MLFSFLLSAYLSSCFSVNTVLDLVLDHSPLYHNYQDSVWLSKEQHPETIAVNCCPFASTNSRPTNPSTALWKQNMTWSCGTVSDPHEGKKPSVVIFSPPISPNLSMRSLTGLAIISVPHRSAHCAGAFSTMLCGTLYILPEKIITENHHQGGSVGQDMEHEESDFQSWVLTLLASYSCWLIFCLDPLSGEMLDG